MYHIDWIEEEEVKNKSILSEIRVEWLFVLFSFVEIPFDDEISSQIRALLRILCEIRASIEEVQDPILPCLNILITITGKYFPQPDFQ